jgi:hypothetical protein
VVREDTANVNVARVANRIWWLVGPLLIVATILTLPVADAEAYGAVPATPGAVFMAAGETAPEIAPSASSQVVHALEPVSSPFRCDTSCNPTNPLNHTAHQARYELPGERFAVLLAHTIPLHVAHADAGNATFGAMPAPETSPPLPPPQI